MVFAIHQHESAMGIHVSPPSWNSCPPPSPLYPSRLSQSTGFGCLASCIKLALVIYFTYDKYMFWSYSLKLSHPRLLPLSPKVCSLRLCLLCCTACMIFSTIFLNFMWVKVAQSCLTLCDPMDYRAHRILQARILEWVAFPSPGDLPNPGINCAIYALLHSVCLSLSDLLHSV